METIEKLLKSELEEELEALVYMETFSPTYISEMSNSKKVLSPLTGHLLRKTLKQEYPMLKQLSQITQKKSSLKLLRIK